MSRLSSDDGILISAEIYDILTKMVKFDNDTGNGDLATLGQLFSGERVTSTYPSQSDRVIDGTQAFCILRQSAIIWHTATHPWPQPQQAHVSVHQKDPEDVQWGTLTNEAVDQESYTLC